MANFYKLRVAWKGAGYFGVGGTLYSHGDEFVLPADQFNKLIKFSDIANGYIEILGESDNSDGAFSSNIFGVLQGKSGTFAKNYGPTSVVNLVPTTTAGVNGVGYQGTNVANDQAIGRRVAIDKLMLRTPTPSQAAQAPYFFVSTGNPEKVTPSVLKYYDNSATTYGNATNGSIAAAAPITWAANDLLIVGYSEKFASVAWSASAANAAATTVTSISYWDGTSWSAFDHVVDNTKELQTGTKTLGRTDVTTDTDCRYVWYEKPSDWKLGGPAGSGISGVYCVAIKFSGALTSLAGGTVYPVLDKPVACVNMGITQKALDATILYNGTTYTDVTDAAVSLENASTVVYFGSTTPFQGLNITISAGNATGRTLVLNYWNGKAWSTNATAAAGAWGGTVTDNTATAGPKTMGQSGTVTWSVVPTAWTPDTISNLTTVGTNAPITISTADMYWVKISFSGKLDASTAASAIKVTSPTSLWLDVAPVGNTFVDAADPIHVTVIDEEANATLECKVVVSDI